MTQPDPNLTAQWRRVVDTRQLRVGPAPGDVTLDTQRQRTARVYNEGRRQAADNMCRRT